MTQFNPYLRLNRLVVFTRSGSIAYDELFQEGVNIIRGHNSSGKSTIVNLIFFALGGDFKKWTTAAQECGDVFAEIEINSEPITVKRTVSTNGNQPMSIFWGSYGEASSNIGQGWQIFPYRISENKKSFSNALFLSLGLPELKGDVDSNITMHQLLRLLYVDQKSLTLDLLMTETFDSSITRQTIADLLFGVYDDTLYSDKLQLRTSEKELEIKKSQFDGILKILQGTNSTTEPKTIHALIDLHESEIFEIDTVLEKIDYSQLEESNHDEELKITEIKTNLLAAQKALSNLQASINEYQFDINDSLEFIDSLENRASYLAESILTRETFVDIQMSHCPNCLSPLEPVANENHCELCKQQLPEDKGSSQIKRMQQEIDNQLRESRKLMSIKEHTLLELEASYPAIEFNVRTLQGELDEALINVSSTHIKNHEDLLIKKGELKSNINYLLKQLKSIEQIEILKQEISTLRAKIDEYKESIASKEKGQRNRLFEAYQLIEDYSVRLLHSDLGRQPEFTSGREVKLDFGKNTFSLDGKNNFSESSNVYLKNSVRFGMFFASLDVDFFRLPRFILCDNIEDKGMEPVRSQSFQNELVEISNESETVHQIIVTTSMIDPLLDNTELCVGDYYDENNKTLRLN